MKKLIYLLFVTLSFTSISFFKIGMAEFTLFHALIVITLFLTVFIAIKKNNSQIKIPHFVLLAAMYISIVNLSYFSEVKLTSYIFSLVIIFEIIFLYNFVKNFTIADIKKIVKAIILLYFINIFISSILIYLEIYPGIWGEIFQIYYFDNRIRPYGFADEPSYASIILIFTLFVLFKADGFTYNKREFKWTAMAVISILLSGSSYGYMLLAILFGFYILKSNVMFIQLARILKNNIFTQKQFLVALFFALLAGFYAVKSYDYSNNKSVQRLISLYDSITSSDKETVTTIKNISKVDGSASMRLVPSIMMIEDFKKSDLKYVLFGRGAGKSIPFFSKLYEGNVTVLGFIPSFVYNYGIIGTFIFCFFFYSLFPKNKFILVILFLLFIFNADFNTQIFTFVLFTIMACKQIEKEREPKQTIGLNAQN